MVDEKKADEGVNKETESKGEDGGNKPESLSFLEQHRLEREKMEKVLEGLKEERSKIENLKAQDILGGKSDGVSTPIEKEEESDIEYSQRLMRGEVPITPAA